MISEPRARHATDQRRPDRPLTRQNHSGDVCKNNVCPSLLKVLNTFSHGVKERDRSSPSRGFREYTRYFSAGNETLSRGSRAEGY